MTDEELKIFREYVQKYCLPGQVMPPGEDVVYPNELANNPQDREEIEGLLESLSKEDFESPNDKVGFDCLKEKLSESKGD